ncbi:unnamed protein product [Paramecium octaurelia]|uniref:Uncharacterized protein n=1 Tax=Paramecium octaurelia TaxID=43137 RepID=A0A8S1YAK3_PAROT|nr:unnamed protein product [Paramecium octaurelia]
MISTFEDCLEHSRSQIGGIYKVKHQQNVQRKVCMKCILKLKLQPEQILSKEEFVNQLLQKANQLNLNSRLESSQSKSFYKQAFCQFDLFQREITSIFTNIGAIIKRISEDETAGDDKFLRLINQNLNPFECSQSELNFLVNFLEGNIFEEWMSKKKFVLSNFQKTGDYFERLLQNAYKTNHLVEQLQTYLINEKTEESIVQLEGLEYVNNQLVKKSFNLITQNNGDKLYLKDGEILRIEKRILGQKSEQFLKKLEQIKHLEFKGQYGINGYKINQWNYFWKGQQVGGGKYDLRGQKKGKWIDLCDDYRDLKNVVEEGDYQQDQRFGEWKIIWNNQQIGGGKYNDQSMKNGKWKELSEGFMDSLELFYSGEYINNKKVGRWDTIYEENIIGGGIYDTENGNKIEKWIEINEGLKDCQKLTYIGEYNKSGQKKGKWEICYEEKIIGGGEYDEHYGNKIGNWTDLSDGFEKESQITYIGEYQNGKKIGRWDIWYQKNYGDYQNEKIGGGSYDEVSDSVKIGEWTEISEKFKGDHQVIFRGKYKNGKKTDKWEILFREKFKEQFDNIGEGSYDDGYKCGKRGRWIEISDVFASYSQIIYDGEYQNNQKVGKWEIKFRESEKSPFSLIGGGQYDEEGINIGQWTEISNRFWRDSQVIVKGVYKNGKKVGNWEIFYKEKGKDKFEFIAGGQYDEKKYGLKIGPWIELDDGFNYNKQIIHKGEYQNGIKIGTWIQMDIKKTKSALK